MRQPISSLTTRPVVAIMTDFGLGDGNVGVMKGVIAGIVPHAQIIDITHDVAPQHVPSAAWILATGYRYYPKGTVFVCVVDPGVGSSRGALAIHGGDWFFVGPDNGLFSYIFAQQKIYDAVMLTNSAYHLPQVSSTFHGRDIFAPAAAHLAGGVALRELGTPIDLLALQRIDADPPIGHGTHIDARILHVDHFGNLITSIPLTMVPALYSGPQVQIIFPATAIVVDRRRRFFADGHDDDRQPFIYSDSSGYVGIAIRNGNVARTLGVGTGTSITFVIAPQ